MRGAHRRRCTAMRGAAGSSPRMRGARNFLNAALASVGIIPAYAGSTCSFSYGRTCSWDHPRVCGEHRYERTGVDRLRGSSPRMRGAPPHVRVNLAVRRIIPAYAGSTNILGTGGLLKRDHPRVCGEHTVRLTDGNEHRGSSPRMRGALEKSRDRDRYRGIIPAYAGSTRNSRNKDPSRRDHPRVCGEHLEQIDFERLIRGSSPRMRGALRSSPCGVRRHGIIPAYAGSTTVPAARRSV